MNRETSAGDVRKAAAGAVRRGYLAERGRIISPRDVVFEGASQIIEIGVKGSKRRLPSACSFPAPTSGVPRQKDAHYSLMIYG